MTAAWLSSAALTAKPRGASQVSDGGGVDRDAEQARRPGGVHLHDAGRMRSRIVVDDPGRDPGSGDFGDERRGTIRGDARQVGRDPLLVAHRRLGAQAQAACRVAHGRSVEDGRLEDDPGRRVGDLGVGPAHDPGEADRSLTVRDHEHPLVEPPLEVVDGDQRLPVSRPADDDPATGDAIRVVRVHRLTELVHHVVRDVHDRRDGPHPGRHQAVGHPGRRLRLTDAVEVARGEPRAQLGVADLDR